MIETITTVFVPSIALNYEGNTLESVGIGGEMFLRNTPLSSENTRLKAENEKLREYAYALEECKREAHYCEFCPHFHRDFEDENPHCDFDFDALRAAVGMEVS